MTAPPKKISFNRKQFAPYLDDLGSDKELEALFLEFLQERWEQRIMEESKQKGEAYKSSGQSTINRFVLPEIQDKRDGIFYCSFPSHMMHTLCSLARIGGSLAIFSHLQQRLKQVRLGERAKHA